MTPEQQLDLMMEWLNVKIQLLPYCVEFGGIRLHKPQLPTFEEFKRTYDDDRYSMAIPHYKDARTIHGGELCKVHTTGMGTTDGIGFRPFNYYMGCKYYTGGNIRGEFTVTEAAISNLKKALHD